MSRKKKAGFTMMEMVISVGIVAMFSSLLLGNIATFRRQSKTNDAALKILTAGQDARQYSVTVRQFQNNLFPSYGVYFDTTVPQRIRIYADCVAEDSPQYNLLDSDDLFYYDPASTACGGASPSGLVEDRTLDAQVSITQLRLIGPATTVVRRAYIEFVRPQPSVWISGFMGPPTNAYVKPIDYGHLEVTVRDDRNGNTKIINMYTSGQMHIQ